MGRTVTVVKFVKTYEDNSRDILYYYFILYIYSLFLIKVEDTSFSYFLFNTYIIVKIRKCMLH